MNAVERDPVPTRVPHPSSSKASYKPKQRSYRKTNLKKEVLAPDSPGTQMSGAQTAAPNRWCRNGDAESVTPKRTRPTFWTGISVEMHRRPAQSYAVDLLPLGSWNPSIIYRSRKNIAWDQWCQITYDLRAYSKLMLT